MRALNEESISGETFPEEFVIRGYKVDSASCRIDTGRTNLKVEPQVIRVLCYLAQHAGEVVSRRQFLRDCWPGVHVSDPALTRCITQLRQIFDDDARHPQVIETISKVGYRLVAPVRPATALTVPRPPQRLNRWLIAATVALAAVVAWQIGETPSDPFASARADYESGIESYSKYTYADNENAIAFFERALAAEPEFAEAHAGLANALSQKSYRYSGEQLPEAEQHAMRAVALQPNSAAAHRALGLAVGNDGRFDEALQSYLTSLELDPTVWQSANNAAGIYLRLRNFDAARQMFEHVIEYQPENVPALTGLGYLESRRGNILAAQQWLQRSLSIRPIQPAATAHYAFLELAQGEHAAAIERCNAMQEVFGDDYDCLRVIAVAGFLNDDIELASLSLAKIERHWPDDSYATLAQALLMSRRGEQEAAMRQIQPVLDGDIRLRGSARFDWDENWLRAAAYAIVGDEVAAFDLLDEAVANGYKFSLWDGMEPAFADIRANARFSEHLVAMNHDINIE